MDKINARLIPDTKTHAKQTVVSIQNKNQNYYYYKNENYYFCQNNFK